MPSELPPLQKLMTQNDLNAWEKLQSICDLLQEKITPCDWVGFYFMEKAKRRLHLGPFAGAETTHKTIAFGKGICGQVADSGKTYLASDVTAEDNYIACSLDVRSEIVIPIYDGPELVAQLDIDSHRAHAFNPDLREQLEELCRKIGHHLGPEIHFDRLFASR